MDSPTTAEDRSTGEPQLVLFDYQFPVDQSPMKHYSLGGMREPSPRKAWDKPTYVPMPGSDPLRVPHLSTKEASLLFGTTVTTWLRSRISQYVDADGILRSKDGTIQLHLKRSISGTNRDGERRLTLPDIERLAYILYSHGQLDASAAADIVTACIAVARLYGVDPTTPRTA